MYAERWEDVVEVDDIHGVKGWYRRALERLESGVGEENRELIHRFLSRVRRDGVTLNTRATYLNILIRMARYFQKPLTEVTEAEFDGFIDCLENRGYARGYIGNYQKAYRKFCSLLMSPVPGWVRDMKIWRTDHKLQPHEILTQEEIARMIRAACNMRDRALVAVLADSGMRVGALGSLRIQNVELQERYGLLYISNTSMSQKTTGPRGIPITWSVGYLGRWLQVHPLRDDCDAPLWVGLKRSPISGGYEALSHTRIVGILREIGARAGVKKRVNPHSFRHAAVTSWILTGLNEQEVKHRAGWARGSSQMFNVYANFSDMQMSDRIFEKYGLKPSREARKLEVCPRCEITLPPGSRFCPRCSLALDRGAVEELDRYDRRVAELLELLHQKGAIELLLESMRETGEPQRKNR